MKKLLLSILILSVILSSGCVGNRKSAFERFKEKNPIEEMLFSKKAKPNSSKPGQEKLNNTRNDTSPIDLSELKNIPTNMMPRHR